MAGNSSGGNSSQSSLVKVLLKPETYGFSSKTSVEHISTHSAHVFLVGSDLAFKLEKNVAYPFMDMSTFEKRRGAAFKEYTLNKRVSNNLYQALIPVLCQADGFVLGDAFGKDQLDVAKLQSYADTLESRHKVVEYLVKMRQFQQEDLLSALADDGKLTGKIIDELVEEAVELHKTATVYQEKDMSFAETMSWVVRDNNDEFIQFAKDGFVDKAQVEELCTLSEKHLKQSLELIKSRQTAGKVRFCHGDLHLRNVVMLDGRPALFDCIEFNDKLAVSDVFYDLAFLIMDLQERQLGDLANRAMNKYVELTGDFEGLQILPLFVSQRAAIRAKVACTEIVACADDVDVSESDHAKHNDSCKMSAHKYLQLAVAFLQEREPVLAAIGGQSGSGKSSVAVRVCHMVGKPPGAVLLRSDVMRKHLYGVAMSQRLPDDAYRPENIQRVYEHALKVARDLLQKSVSVFLDATFIKTENQQAVSKLGNDLRVPTCAIWLDCPFETRYKRTSSRRDDASDMTAAKLSDKQIDVHGSWHHVDANRALDVVVEDVKQLLQQSTDGSK